jgi:hypothetical protein
MSAWARIGVGVLLAVVLTVQAAGDAPQLGNPKIKVKNAVPIKAYAFDLRDVRLLDSPFKHAMELDRKYLLSLDNDRLLHTFRVNAKLPSKAQPLGGWEEPKGELRGHFVGHYLSACALMYASTGDEQLKEKANQLVAGLAECQKALGSGYLSAYPESFIDRVIAQQRVWAPWYTLHKIYAGLLDMYIYCDNAQALQVATQMADWAKGRMDKLSDEQMQNMLATEHGGMNETLANIHAVTGNADQLTLARRFNHMALIGPFSKRDDMLTGLHANTQIPKFIGAAREYELTGDESLKTAADYFWRVVAQERSYVIGGHSDGESFSPKERLSEFLGQNTAETCNTYNMLKLTRHLFCWDPRAEYSDFYERALYNHILASQNPETGMMCYYVPLRPGAKKVYNTPTDSFWCCTGTGVENHAKYGDSIYFHDGANGLIVNLFIPSELDWKAQGVKVRQETKYPAEEATRLVFACKSPTELKLSIRHPYWATSGTQVSVNGEKQKVKSKPGSYATLARVFKDGDVVEIALPMSLRTEGFHDNPRRLAFLYGPVVLCAEVEEGKPVPAIVTEQAALLAQFKPAAGTPLTFTAAPQIFRTPGETGRAITLTPFYQMHNKAYTVYWDVLTSGQWEQKVRQQEADQARRTALEARTVDQYTPGLRRDETARGVKGERTTSGMFGGRRWRHATDGGWFEFQMKALPDQPLDLLCAYWGGDSGSREFDVLVDGKKIATQKLENNRPGQFFDEVYPIPEDVTRGKDTVTVRLQALPGKWAGGLFECRVMRKEK